MELLDENKSGIQKDILANSILMKLNSYKTFLLGMARQIQIIAKEKYQYG